MKHFTSCDLGGSWPWYRPLIFAALIWREQDSRRAWRGVIADHLLPHLMVGSGARRRLRPAHLLPLVWLVGVVALAGPTWQREPAPFADETAALVVVLEVSPTMLARDIQPTRLDRSIHKITDLLSVRPGAKTALVAYSGSAHLVMPLTRDARIIELFAGELSPEIMPVDGDVAAQAVELANEQIRRDGSPGSILLITDGVPADQFGPIAAQRDRGGASVHLLGVGSDSREPAPAGGPAAPALDRDGLQRAAQAAGGTLTLVTPDDRDVRQLAGRIERSLSEAMPDDGGQRWLDAGYWLVPLVVLICLAWSRPGWTIRWTTILLLMIGVGGSAIAGEPDNAEKSGQQSGVQFIDLWLTHDQQAARLFERGQYAQAARRFASPTWRATALYRAGQFEQAAAALARVDSAECAFNRGNALVMMGKYEEAMTAYDRAIQLRPNWSAAKSNRPNRQATTRSAQTTRGRRWWHWWTARGR